jgi:hypothetical protein
MAARTKQGSGIRASQGPDQLYLQASFSKKMEDGGPHVVLGVAVRAEWSGRLCQLPS